ncbi:NACHT, LRR and PYD domains-containing protein 5 [Galemys pyrenaicus]|uniref:NACHT, LRR and PYD domains-containing protein 5 n=1 Tax=Galemys pyrenaicus TaxID=202257 RepID=A0A8J6DJL6_GALPY|nr:NACHT, LRR and PYD domains-containing protein 5 [Galemys pyrenaicus]
MGSSHVTGRLPKAAGRRSSNPSLHRAPVRWGPSRAMSQAGALEAKTREPDPRRQQWDYKGLVMTKFAMAADHDLGAHFAPDSPEMRALAGAFDADADGFRPRTVVLLGPAGSGKSTLARRVLLGWVRDELFPGAFSHVFLLAAADAQREGSLAELLAREWADSAAPLEDALARPEGLLFVLDGFDDPALGCLRVGGELCADWAARRPARVLVHSLLRKALLPACSLLVTARAAGARALMSLLVAPRCLALEGVSLAQSVGLLRGPGEAGRALLWAADSPPLLQPCGDPAACALLGEALRLQRAAGGTPGRTLTGVYTTLVFQLLAPGAAAPLAPEARAVLRALCGLAADGLWGLRGTFGTQHLRARGLQRPELCALLHARRPLPGLGGETGYAFLHPSLQEFCAALHYVLQDLDTDVDPRTPLLESSGWRAGLGACAVQVKRFLFGLASGEVAATLGALLGQPVPQGLRGHLLRWVSLLSRPAGAPEPQDTLEAFYCLFETQDEEFARSALSGCEELRLRLHRRADLTVAAFCLPQCRGLRRLRAHLQEASSKEEAAGLARAVEANVCVLLQCRALVEAPVAECWGKFCSALSTHPSLQYLELSGSLLGEWTMKTLCVKMRQPACEIQTLKLEGAQVSLGLRHVWRVLISNPNVKALSLENASLSSDDLAVACEALRHPRCSLESLRLDRCALPRAYARPLARALETSRSLRALGLVGNLPAGRNAGSLRDALRASPCALQRLVLGSCGLGAADCRDLAAGLGAGRSVTHLCLAGNALGSEGASALCQALRRPGCALQRLTLDDCGLDVAACGFLAFALMDAPQLTHLSLSTNPVRDDGAKLLCEALRSPGCRLRGLALAACSLTAACCRSLAVAVVRSPHLRGLDLAANMLGDTGVAALCEGLKQGTSSLERLGLEACELTDAGCEALSSALRLSKRLASVNLARNHLSVAGARKLCQAFCATSKLQIVGGEALPAAAVPTPLGSSCSARADAPPRCAPVALLPPGSPQQLRPQRPAAPAACKPFGALQATGEGRSRGRPAVRRLWKQQQPLEVSALLEEARLSRPGPEVAAGWHAPDEDGRNWWRS